MKKRQIFLLLTALLCLTSIKSFASEVPYGIVKFSDCITDSKYGMREQENFEKLRDQLTTIASDYEKQLQDLAGKFNDPDFMDSLSPEAEQEMHAHYQSLNEEMSRFQNQYMQTMQQANMQLMQAMNTYISNASRAVASNKKLSTIVREEACFHYDSSQDVTKPVIDEMDKAFDAENKAQLPAE